ncbi:MAG: hypothetical protein LUE27_06845 [Clostridia bacterium]|nr:hypothetical protein [Clostridia bacterium]
MTSFEDLKMRTEDYITGYTDAEMEIYGKVESLERELAGMRAEVNRLQDAMLTVMKNGYRENRSCSEVIGWLESYLDGNHRSEWSTWLAEHKEGTRDG